MSHGMFGVSGSGDTSGFGGLVHRAIPVISTERPWGGWYDEAYDEIVRAYPEFGDAVEAVVVDRGELTIHIAKAHLLDVLKALRDDLALRFELLSSLSGVDYPDDTTGRPLHVVYHLTSLTWNRRLRLEVATSYADPHIPSAVATYPTADWLEREDVGLLRHHLRRPPRPDADLHARRLGGPPPAQGLPARRDRGGVQGRARPPPDQRRSYA